MAWTYTYNGKTYTGSGSAPTASQSAALAAAGVSVSTGSSSSGSSGSSSSGSSSSGSSSSSPSSSSSSGSSNSSSSNLTAGANANNDGRYMVDGVVYNADGSYYGSADVVGWNDGSSSNSSNNSTSTNASNTATNTSNTQSTPAAQSTGSTSSYNPSNYRGTWSFDGHTISAQGKEGGATVSCSGPLYNNSVNISASNDSQLENGVEAAVRGMYGQIVKLEMQRDHGASITWGTMNNGNRCGYGMGDDGKIWLVWFTSDIADNANWTSWRCDPGMGYDTAISKGFNSSFAEGIKSLDAQANTGNNQNNDNNTGDDLKYVENAGISGVQMTSETRSYRGYQYSIQSGSWEGDNGGTRYGYNGIISRGASSSDSDFNFMCYAISGDPNSGKNAVIQGCENAIDARITSIGGDTNNDLSNNNNNMGVVDSGRETYKSHTIGYVIQNDNGAYSGTVVCTGPDVETTKYANTYPTQADCKYRIDVLINQIKSQIDTAQQNSQPEPEPEPEEPGEEYPKEIEATTENYNGYTIRKNITQYGVNGYQIDCNCQAVGYNPSAQTSTTESAARTKLANMVTAAKQAIDQYISGQQQPEPEEPGEEPGTGEGTKIIDRELWGPDGSDKKAYITVIEYIGDDGSRGYDVWLESSDPQFKEHRETKGSYDAALKELQTQFANMVGGTAPGNGEPTTGDWDGIYRWLDDATARGNGYIQGRNGAMATNIANQMKGQTYASADQAKRDYLNKFQDIVNSNGGELQITADNKILGPDAEKWQNTIATVERLVLQKLGVASWSQLVNGTSTTPGTPSTPGTGTSGSWNDWLTNVSNQSTYLFDWLNQWYGNSMNGWAERQSEIGNYAPQIQQRIDELKTGFNDAASHLQAASGLQKKAQKIYSDQNIQKMNQQLRQMGFDAGKAAPAVYYQVTKQMANTAVELAKLQAEEETTLANLETQKTQLQDQIRAAGIEADQWSQNMLNELEKQIQQIRDNMQSQRTNILGTWTLQPQLDVASNLLQADIDNIAQYYQSQFLDQYPDQMLLAAAHIFGSDWTYCDASTAMSYNSSVNFADYLAKCAESIRNNKVRYETQVAQAGSTKYYNSGTESGSTGTTTTTPVYVL